MSPVDIMWTGVVYVVNGVGSALKSAATIVTLIIAVPVFGFSLRMIAWTNPPLAGAITDVIRQHFDEREAAELAEREARETEERAERETREAEEREEREARGRASHWREEREARQRARREREARQAEDIDVEIDMVHALNLVRGLEAREARECARRERGFYDLVLLVLVRGMD